MFQIINVLHTWKRSPYVRILAVLTDWQAKEYCSTNCGTPCRKKKKLLKFKVAAYMRLAAKKVLETAD